MYASINLDAVVKYIKYIVDGNRCPVCDKTDGTRMRYVCGHASCEDCLAVSPDCSVCLTPSERPRESVADKPFSQRVQNAVNLLNVFQNEFHVDVYKRQRISEQLKVEKELFPECIQAPTKYFNKRKSFKNSKNNKENRLSQLPGEEISPISIKKMEQPNVELWLEKYVRKPFADLNSNDERLRKGPRFMKKEQNVMNTENVQLLHSTRKRSHFKSALSVVKNQSLIDKLIKPVKKIQTHKRPKVEQRSSVKSETFKSINAAFNFISNENKEGSIGMDEDETVILINSSQDIPFDKDMNAWIAVQEAEKNRINESEPVNISSKSNENISQDEFEKPKEANVNLINKVPFYLMGYFSQNCTDCNVSNNNGSDINMAEPNVGKVDMGPAKDVSITVENKSFITVITVNSIANTEKKDNSMQSVEVQTDIVDSVIAKNKIMNQVLPPISCDLSSQDLFECDRKINNNINRTQCKGEKIPIIIEESDSDGELDASVSLEVTAEIHKSCEAKDYGILADIDDLEEHSKRTRRRPRGFTPTSTDSSDKENYNPNKKKQADSSKKKPSKK